MAMARKKKRNIRMRQPERIPLGPIKTGCGFEIAGAGMGDSGDEAEGSSGFESVVMNGLLRCS